MQTRVVSGEVIEANRPLKVCKVHGAIYDVNLLYVSVDKRREPRSGQDMYRYYRCKDCICRKKRERNFRKTGMPSLAERKRMKEAVFAKMQEMTGYNPVVKNVQKKVLNMFINLRSPKK